MFLPTILERIKENLSVGPRLGYVVDATNKVIFEKEIEEAKAYAKAFNKDCHYDLPYRMYDFDNPFDLINNWTFYDLNGNVIKYDEDFNEYIVSVN
jgi:hypothetical protein